MTKWKLITIPSATALMVALQMFQPFAAHANTYRIAQIVCHAASWTNLCPQEYIIDSQQGTINSCVRGATYRYTDGPHQGTCYWADYWKSCLDGSIIQTIQQSSSTTFNNCLGGCST